MSWLTDAEWIHRRQRGEGLCDGISAAHLARSYDIPDATYPDSARVCDQLATDVVVVGNRYCARCPEHAEVFKVDTAEVQARFLVRCAAKLNGQEPLLG